MSDPRNFVPKEETTERQRSYAESLGKIPKIERTMWDRRIEAQRKNIVEVGLPDGCDKCGNPIDATIFFDGEKRCGPYRRKYGHPESEKNLALRLKEKRMTRGEERG